MHFEGRKSSLNSKTFTSAPGWKDDVKPTSLLISCMFPFHDVRDHAVYQGTPPAGSYIPGGAALSNRLHGQPALPLGTTEPDLHSAASASREAVYVFLLQGIFVRVAPCIPQLS